MGASTIVQMTTKKNQFKAVILLDPWTEILNVKIVSFFNIFMCVT